MSHIWISHGKHILEILYHITHSNENDTPPKSTKSRNSNFSVHIQIKPKSEFEFVPRDTEESEFLNMVDSSDVAFSVETVMSRCSFMSHVTHLHELCHTSSGVMSHMCGSNGKHIGMSHVTHMHESCHTHAWVTSHICMSHVTHMNEPWQRHIWHHIMMLLYESCHKYEWVTSHICMSHVTHVNVNEP